MTRQPEQDGDYFRGVVLCSPDLIRIIGLDGKVEFRAHDGGSGTAAVVTMMLGSRPRVGG